MRLPVPKLGHNDLKEVKKPLSTQAASHNVTKSAQPDQNPPQYSEAINSNSDLESVSSSQPSSRRAPVSRRSSSNVLRAMAAPLSGSSSGGKKTPQRNVPYKPSKELQKHIDKLGTDVNVNADLTTSLSGTRTEYFHVLPSFQMFQSTLTTQTTSLVLLLQPLGTVVSTNQQILMDTLFSTILIACLKAILHPLMFRSM